MRWPWISRKRHEALVDAHRAATDAIIIAAHRQHEYHSATLVAELEIARQDRIRAENESATLRDQLVAERHRQGLPASVDGDAA